MRQIPARPAMLNHDNVCDIDDEHHYRTSVDYHDQTSGPWLGSGGCDRLLEQPPVGAGISLCVDG